MQIRRFSNPSDCKYKVPKKPIKSIYNANYPCVDLSYHSTSTETAKLESHKNHWQNRYKSKFCVEYLGQGIQQWTK